MAELYNIREKRVEKNIPDSEVQERILSNNYDYLGGPDASIPLSMGDNKVTYVPSHSAAGYIRAGAQYITPLRLQEMRDNKEFAQSALGNVAAIGTGLDDYFFAGAGGHVLEAMGLVDKGATEAVSAESPWIHHGTGIGGSILAAAFTGGGSALEQASVKGGASAAKLAVGSVQLGAKEAAREVAEKSILKKGFDAANVATSNFTLPGLGAQAARAVENKVHAGIMKHGDKLVPYRLANSELAKRWGPHAAKMISASIGAGVEGAVWGAGAGISESIIGEPGESAELILDSITDNVLIGMAFGGAIGGITPFLAGSAGVSANLADKALDVSGRSGGAILSKAAPHIARIAKNNGYSPKVVEWLRKTIETGDVEAIKELDAFVENLGGTAADMAKVFDVLAVTEQFRQISDIQGFNLDVLEDAVEATIRGQSIPDDIGRIFDADSPLSKLKESLTRETQTYHMTRGQKDLAPLHEKSRAAMERLSKQVKEKEALLRRAKRRPHLDENIKLPDDSVEVLNNASDQYERVRKALISAKEAVPSAEVGKSGAISNLLSQVNEQEAALYRSLFSKENFERIKLQYAHELKKTTLKKAELTRLEKVRTQIDSALDQGKLDSLGVKLKSFFDKKGINESDLGFATGELSYALTVLKQTGDRSGIDKFIEAVGKAAGDDAAKAEKIVKAWLPGGVKNKRTTELYKDGILKSDGFDAATLRWEGLGDGFGEIVEKLDVAVNEMRRTGNPFVRRTSKTGDRLAGDITTSFAEDGILGHIAEGGSTSIKNVIDSILLNLDYRAFDKSLAARAFKSLEDIQTTVKKSVQYGVLPDSPAVVDAVEVQIVDMLRKEMKNTEKWGQMAVLKRKFDDAAEQFTEVRSQVEATLGTKFGTKLLGDPDKFMAFIRGLKQENFMDLNKINEYGDSGRFLLDFIRRHFDAIDPNTLPPQLKSTLEDRLKEIDGLGFKVGSTAIKEPHLGWDDRLKRMIDFSQDTSTGLKKKIGEIQEKMPIIQALQSQSARDSNMSNLISDVGRGGAVSALMYGVTGSPMLAAASGLAVGGASMALSPKRVLSLIRQMSVLKKSQKEAIAEYMADWADNKVPKAAITRQWERTSRSMLMIAAAPTHKDIAEGRTKVRQKAAENRSKEHWASKIDEAMNSELTEENFYDVSVSINKLANSPFLIKRFSDEMTKIFEQTPDIRNAMKEVIMRKIKIAHGLMPKSNPGTMFSDPVPPSTFQLQEFGRQLQILNNPTDTVLTAMLSGTLTPKMVRTFKQGWPKLYDEMATAAVEAVSTKEKRAALSNNQKMVLSILLNSPVMDNSEFERLAGTFAEEEKQQAAGGGMRGPQGLKQTTGASSQGTMAYVRQ